MPGVKRFRRFILNAATALSLLLCVGVAGLWVRSYWTADSLVRNQKWQTQTGDDLVSRWRDMNVWSSRGRLMAASHVGYMPSQADPIPPHPSWKLSHQESFDSPATDTMWHRLGLLCVHEHYADMKYGVHYDTYTLGMPDWLTSLVLSLLPLLRLIRHLRGRSLVLSGHCPHCGYDLRATPGRCPECGNVPAAAGR
jgi:hypothetical protein